MLQREKSDEVRTKRKRQEIKKRRMIIHGRKVEEERGETSQEKLGVKLKTCGIVLHQLGR